MIKKMLHLWGIFFIIIAIAICIPLGYKFFIGTHIRHYNQYIFPCQGRIIASESGEARIRLHILDEQKISELSDKQNIKNVDFITQDGGRIKATGWEINENAGFYQGDKYAAKELNIVATFKEQTVIQKIVLAYPDKKEIFDIGELKIYPLTPNDMMAYIQIISTPLSFDGQEGLINGNTGILTRMATALIIKVNTPWKNIRIDKIDLGVHGMGIDPSTAKIMPSEIDFGQSFMNEPSNSIYFLQDRVNSLPAQDMGIEIQKTKNEFTSVLIALRQDKEYKAEAASLYMSPIFTCTDTSSNEQFIYGNNSNYYISTPLIVNAKTAEKLLKEHGQ